MCMYFFERLDKRINYVPLCINSLADAVGGEVFQFVVKQNKIVRIIRLRQRFYEYVFNFNNVIINVDVEVIRLLDGYDGVIFILHDIDVHERGDEP